MARWADTAIGTRVVEAVTMTTHAWHLAHSLMSVISESLVPPGQGHKVTATCSGTSGFYTPAPPPPPTQ